MKKHEVLSCARHDLSSAWPLLRNYVVSATDIVSARDYACRTFGTESVGSVEAVESLSLLPKDTEYLDGR